MKSFFRRIHKLYLSKKIGIIFIVISLLSVSYGFNFLNRPESMIDKTTVKNLDLEKYLGTWYEIARYDHRFERGLVGVTAKYSMRDDGKIKVVNSGYMESFSGQFKEAIGKAKIPDPENEPAKLKVSFFWIFYADYLVLELDKNYQWAVIGSSSDNYLWILSRTPQLDNALYQKILDKIARRGYDISGLIKVEQRKQ